MRARIHVCTTIAAPPAAVWRAIEDIETHVEWMADAESIEFPTEQRTGLGTEAVCETVVGPWRVTDRLRVTEWEPPRVMGIEHRGIVTGWGRFVLEGQGSGTRFCWTEQLAFPWRLGGPIGALVAPLVLGPVWRRNLARLRDRVEAAQRALRTSTTAQSAVPPAPGA